MVFISVVSLIRSTSSRALFVPCQNKKCAWDEVFIYKVTFVRDLRFRNTSIHNMTLVIFTDNSSLMEIPFLTLNKENSDNVLRYYLCQ